VLFDIYATTGDEKYKRAIDLLHRQLLEHPRTNEGSFWHKLIYPNQVWLDGLYMAQVFAVRWATEYGGRPELGDIARQFATVRSRMWMPEKSLYCHGYDETREIFWADKTTGQSKNVWLRAVGWFLAALVDVLGYWPDNKALAAQLKEAAGGLLPHMDKAAGMFYQVVDAGGKQGNYLETSGSAMAAYAFLKGARLGALPEEYREHGRRVFEGICEGRLSEGQEGLSLSGICLVAGLGPKDNTRRDGAFEYYISEPVVENDAKGVAPFLMCYSEIMRLREE
jgi:unsaturated rhamnogalacturonyl hydrolase